MKRVFHPLLGAMLMVACVAMAPTPSNAIDTLTDLNSVVSIDPTTSANVFNWSVDGVNNLYQQTWFVGVGAAPQVDVNSLSAPSSTVAGPFASYTFTGTGFSATETYTLAGGATGSGTSDLAEQFRITNTSGSTQTYRIYSYNDYDLGGSPAGDTATIESEKDGVTQTGKGVVLRVEGVPNATHAQVSPYAALLTSLNGGVAYTLNDFLGPQTGDETFAFEWDVTVANNSSFILSTDNNLAAVPVPPSALLLGSGLLGLVGWRRFGKS